MTVFRPYPVGPGTGRSRTIISSGLARLSLARPGTAFSVRTSLSCIFELLKTIVYTTSWMLWW